MGCFCLGITFKLITTRFSSQLYIEILIKVYTFTIQKFYFTKLINIDFLHCNEGAVKSVLHEEHNKKSEHLMLPNL